VDLFLEALLIFGLRVLGISIGTLATLTMVQGRRVLAMATNFFTALIYIVALGRVVSNLDNIWNIMAYCGGVAVGTLLGMAWEQRMALGFAEVRFISPVKSDAVADALRDAGFGATETYGHGRDCPVGIVEVIVPRKSVNAVMEIAQMVDKDAVATVTEARIVRRGYWSPMRR